MSFFSLIGDANHDGMVNFDDYLAIDNGFNNHLTGWSNGDFNGNGVVNFDDYVLIDANYGTRLPTPQTTPMSIDATAAYGNGTIAVHWVAPTQTVDGYHIYRSRDGVHFTMVHDNLGQSSVDYLDSDVAEGAKYTYRVRAYVNTPPSGDNAPPWEEVVSTDRTTAVMTMPGPLQLSAEDISGDGVTLTWSDNSLGEANFEVWMIRDGELGYGERVAVVPGHEGVGAVSTRVTGLTPLTGYTFYVTAGTNDIDSLRSIGCPVHTGPDISGVASAIEGTQLAYTSSSWDSSGGAWRVSYVKHPQYENDPELEIASGDEPTIRFNAVDDGEYRVALTVTRGGNNYTSVRRINVSNGVPVINSLDAPTHISGRHVAHFVSDVTDPGTRDHPNYDWAVKQKNPTDNSYGEAFIHVEHGDPNFHFIPNPPTSGADFTYRVELNVTDGDGGTASMVRKFTVAADSTGGNGTTESVVNMNALPGAEAMAVQSDGKIVLVGGRNTIYVARYNADLTPDTQFGTNGLMQLDFGDGTANTEHGNGQDDDRLGNGQPRAVTIDPNGRILIVGRIGTWTSAELAVFRLQPNGQLDETFSDHGKFFGPAHFPHHSSTDGNGVDADRSEGDSVQVIQLGTQPWILVGGWASFSDPINQQNLALFAFKNDGTLADAIDYPIAGFPAQGVNVHSIVARSNADGPASVLVGGESEYPGNGIGAQGATVLAQVNFNPANINTTSGAFGLDTTFGDLVSEESEEHVGYVITNYENGGDIPSAPGLGDVLKQVLLAPDGSIFTVGAENDQPPTGDNHTKSWVDLASAGVWDTAQTYLTIARYTEHGELDTSFGGGDGFITGKDSDLVNKHLGLGVAATLQIVKPKPGTNGPTNYKIIVGGAADMGSNNVDFYLARFDQTGALEQNFGGPGTDRYTYDRWHVGSTELGDVGAEGALAVAFTDDGILAAGGIQRDSNVLDSRFALLRYRPPTASNISLSATARRDGKIGLNWIDGSWSDEGYVVERAPDDDDFTNHPEHIVKLAHLGGDATSFIDRNVEAGVRYYYRVEALKLNAAGDDVVPDSAHQSNLATAVTLPTDAGWKPVDTVVFEQDHLQGQELLSHVSLSSDGIYLLRASGIFDLGHEHDGSDPILVTDAEYANFASGQEDWQKFTWPGGGKANWGIAIDDISNGHPGPWWGPPGALHSYEIGYIADNRPVHFHIDDGPGYYDDNNKITSDPLRVEIFRAAPTTPAELNLSVDRPNKKVTLTWTDTSPHRHKRFYVQRKVGNGDFVAFDTVDWVNGTSSYQLVDDTVQTDQHYTYRVRALDGDDSSAFSNIATAFLVNHPPMISPIPTQFVTVDSAYTYPVDAYDLEDQRDLHFALVGDHLPGGMTINTGDGLIQGYNAPSGDVNHPFSVGVKVTDQDDASTERQFLLRVVDGPARPAEFLTHPQDSLASDGHSASLYERAHDPNPGGDDTAIKYAWRIWSKPPGADDPAYNAEASTANKDLNVTFYKSGPYSFLVTAYIDGAPAAQTIHQFDVTALINGISLTPSNTIINPGESERFSVSGIDQFDDAISIDSHDLDWTGTAVTNLHFDKPSQTYTAPADLIPDETLNVAYQNYSASSTIGVSEASFTASASKGPDPSDTRRLILTSQVTPAPDAQHVYTYTWTCLDHGDLPAPVIQSPHADATGVRLAKAGHYKFQLEVRDATQHRRRPTIEFDVIGLPTLMDVTPHSPVVQFQTDVHETPGRATLSARILDQFGDEISLTSLPDHTQRSLQWNVLSGGGAFAPADVPTPSNQRYTAPQYVDGAPMLAVYNVKFTQTDTQTNQTITEDFQSSIQLAIDLPATRRITSPVSSGQSAAEITKDYQVEGIIDYPSEDAQLTSWELQVARADVESVNQTWQTIATGTNQVGSLADGPALIATLKPASLPDGLYEMRVFTHENVRVNENQWNPDATSTSDTVRIQIHTDLKLGNLTLPFTDLSVPIGSGPPINITRIYDSQHAGEQGEFGYGWRLEGQDVQFRITARPGTYSDGETRPEFRAGDLVYITLPGGQQQVFMFKPIELGGGVLGITYQPAFIPVDGSGSTLEPLRPDDRYPNAVLIAATNNGDDEFYMERANGGQVGYNPGVGTGGGYLLTTQDGTKYTILCEADSRKAHLSRIDDTNGNYITFSDGTITSSSSAITATITRASSVVSGVRLTSGASDVTGTITYTYDPDTAHATDLIGVTDRSGTKTTYEYADKLVLLHPGATGNVYVVLYDLDGKAWNNEDGDFRTPTSGDFAAKYTLQARLSGDWLIADLPAKLPANTWFRAKFYVGTASLNNTNVIASQVRTSTYQHAHSLTGIIDPRSVRTLSATYDEAGKLDSLVDAQNKAAPLTGDGFDGDHAVRQVTDLAGQKTTFAYNKLGDVVREVRPVTNEQGDITAWQVIVRDYDYAPFGPDVDGVDTTNVLLSTTEYEPLEIPVADAPPDPQTLADPDYDLSNLVANHVTEFDGQKRHIFRDEVRGPNGRWMITTYEDYDTLGHPQKVIDPNGNITKYQYDSAGNLQYLTNPLGEVTKYTYVGGRLTKTEQFRGAEWRTISDSTYYSSTNESTGAVEGMLESTTDAAGLKHVYTYWPNGLTKEVRRQWHDDAGDHNVLDSYTEYDDEDRVKAVKDGDNNWTYNYYDALGKLSYTVDKFGGNTISTYDTRGNLVRTLYPDGTETRTSYDAMGRADWTTDRYKTHTTYSISNAHVVTITSEDNETLATTATHTIYDSLGRAVGTERRKDVLIKLVADPYAQMADEMQTAAQPLHAEVAAEGSFLSDTSTVYDDKGRVSDSTSRYDPDDDDPFEVTTHTDHWPDGRTKTVSTAFGTDLAAPTNYDENRNWIEEIVPSGTAVTGDDFTVKVKFTDGTDDFTSATITAAQFNADAADALQTALDGCPHVTLEVRGNALRLTTLAAYIDKPFDVEFTIHQSSTSTATLRHRTVHTTWTEDAQNHETTTEYDELGREVKTTFADGSFTETSYAEFGSIVSKTDQMGQVTENHYDIAGRLTDVYLPEVADPDHPNTPARPHYIYGYDKNGNEISQEDPEGRVTTFTYDEQNRRTDRILPAVNGSTVTEHTDYDTKGREEYHKDFKGNQEVIKYDSLSRVDEERFFAPNADVETTTPAQEVKYHYDDLGRVRETEDTRGSAQPRITDYEHDRVQGQVTRISSQEGWINYLYDPSTGRLMQTYTESDITDDRYDELGRLKTVMSHRAETGAVVNSTGYTYDDLGNVVTSTQSSGSTVVSISDYDYHTDPLGRLTKLTVKKDATHPLFEQTFHLRADGLRDDVTEKRYDGLSTSATSTTFIDWSYDADGRLIGETRGVSENNTTDYITTFTLDLVGNRRQKATTESTNETIDYQYNDRDQLYHEHSNVSGNTDYEYDDNGSLKTKTVGSQVTLYTWDVRNRMTQVDADNNAGDLHAGDARYTYDADGVRVKETVKDANNFAHTTFYVNDPYNPTGYTKAIEEKPSNVLGTAPTRSFEIGLAVEAQYDADVDVDHDGESDGSRQTYLLHDAHGSTRALLGTTSEMIEAYDYDAFGDEIGFNANNAGTQWLYGSGGLFDLGSGFDYNLARFRNEFHFISQDSREAGPGDLANSNLYVFAGADPITFADPTGRNSLEELNYTSYERAKQETGAYRSLPMVRQSTSNSVNLMKLYSRLAAYAAGTAITGGTLIALSAYWQKQLLKIQQQQQAVAQAYQQAVAKAVATSNYTKSQVENLPVFYVYRSGADSTPKIWQNDQKAMVGLGTMSGVPAPIYLNYQPGGAKLNRPLALAMAASRGITAKPGESLDEYPFASTVEGGPKPWLRVSPVPIPEQEIQRKDIRAFYAVHSSNFKQTFTFLVVLVP